MGKCLLHLWELLGGGGGDIQKRQKDALGVQSRKTTLKAFILSHSQESVIHLANIYCVPTVCEAFCQGLATEAKGTVLVLRKSGLEGGTSNNLCCTAGHEWAPVHPGVGAIRGVDSQICCCLYGYSVLNVPVQRFLSKNNLPGLVSKYQRNGC